MFIDVFDTIKKLIIYFNQILCKAGYPVSENYICPTGESH